MAYPYHPPGGPGYPPPPGGAGYPPAQIPPTTGPGGYPPAPGGYPPPAGGLGYPPPTGYPPVGPGYGHQAPPTGGYPGGFPQQPPPAGYGQPPTGGYPLQPPAGGYPPQGGYQQPPAGGYPPPAAGGYHQQPPQGAYQQPPPMGYPQPPASQTPPPDQVLSRMSTLNINETTGHGTIKAPPTVDPEKDAEYLRKAMRGVGTDEAAIINLLASRTNAQRVLIRQRYKTMFGKDLMNDLKSELSGNLEECLLALMEPSVLYDAKCLRQAMRGAGTDEETLIDILCTRTNAQIVAIKKEYASYYHRDLEKDCVSETSGHFKRLLVSMCQGAREEHAAVDMAKAKAEAQQLYQAGEKKWGTDESRFNQVLAVRSFPQLRATFDEYVKISQRDILNSIDREMSGDLRAGFKAIVITVRDASQYYAERLFKSMKGAGTDDSLLIRIIVSRSEIDLVEIKQAFLCRYHKTLYKMIEGDCSGDYKRLLLAIVGSDV